MLLHADQVSLPGAKTFSSSPKLKKEAHLSSRMLAQTVITSGILASMKLIPQPLLLVEMTIFTPSLMRLSIASLRFCTYKGFSVVKSKQRLTTNGHPLFLTCFAIHTRPWILYTSFRSSFQVMENTRSSSGQTC